MSVSSDKSTVTGPRFDSFMESFGAIIRETRQHATVMRGLSVLLQQDHVGLLNEDQKELMNALAERTELLTHYLSQAIHLSEIDISSRPPETSICNVDELLQRAIIHVLNRSKNRNALPNINTTLVDKKLHIFVDELDIERAFFQVVDNAFRYNPKNSPITIQTTDTETHVQIIISDMGIGIALKDQNNAFQRHTRIWREDYPQSSGAGLGLYITQQFVLRNKGAISLNSNENEGCVIFILLPKKVALQDFPE